MTITQAVVVDAVSLYVKSLVAPILVMITVVITVPAQREKATATETLSVRAV